MTDQKLKAPSSLKYGDGAFFLSKLKWSEENMIKYERLDQKTGALQDVKLITDDSQAELAGLGDTFKDGATDFKTFENIEAAHRGDDGNFEIIIPGDEVGEVAEIVYAVDNGILEEEMDRWNREAIEEIEET